MTGDVGREHGDPFEREDVEDRDSKPVDPKAKKLFEKAKKDLVERIRDARKHAEERKNELEDAEAIDKKDKNKIAKLKDQKREADKKVESVEKDLEKVSDELKKEVHKEIKRLDMLDEAQERRNRAESVRREAKTQRRLAKEQREKAQQFDAQAKANPQGTDWQRDMTRAAGSYEDTADIMDRTAVELESEAKQLEDKAKPPAEPEGRPVDEVM